MYGVLLNITITINRYLLKMARLKKLGGGL